MSRKRRRDESEEVVQTGESEEVVQTGEQRVKKLLVLQQRVALNAEEYSRFEAILKERTSYAIDLVLEERKKKKRRTEERGEFVAK